MARFLLVHSPLVGPTTWRWVADELTGRGHEVVLPSLLEAAAAGDATQGADIAALATGGRADVVVGHSGAGPLLPLIASRMTITPRRLVFVDAAIPPCDGAFTYEPQFVEFLRGLPKAGVLPPWSEWFGEDAMEAMVPDAAQRAAIVADLPQLPLSYFDQPIQMPAGWCVVPSGFILLSEGYRRFVMVARRRNWPVAELPGTHLDIVNQPALIAEALVRAAGVA